MSESITTEEPGGQPTTETPSVPSSEAPAVEPGAAASAEGGGTLERGTEPDTGEGQPEKTDLQRLREQLSGGDEGLLKSLGRYQSVEAISKAFKEARQAAKTASKPLTLGEKATEDEIKAYREAVGIPDEPADYPVSFREGFAVGENDGEILGSFKEFMHASNADPKAAKAALEWYQDYALSQQQAMSKRLSEVAKETQSQLRAEWGGEFDGNIAGVQQLLTTHLGNEGFDEMMDLRLIDGSRLQDHAPLVKMLGQIAADYYGGNAIMTGDVETTSKTLQERKDELMALRATDEAKYFSDDVQSQLVNINKQLDKLKARR